MAFDAFLKIDGIEGDSMNAKHKGEIEVLSFSWGIQQQTQSSSSGGGGGAGKAQIADLQVMKKVDVATPQLFAACCTGEHIRDALFTVEQRATSPKGRLSYLKIKLQDVLISSVSPGGGGGDTPVEQVSLNFVKVELEYQDERGQSQAALCNFASDNPT